MSPEQARGKTVDKRTELLPEDTPVKIRELLPRCLHKDARHRLRDISEAWVAIEEAKSEPSAPTAPIQRKSSPLAWTLAGLFALAAAALWFRAPPQAPTPPVRRFTIERHGSFAVIPVLPANGARLAYDAASEGRGVFVRDLDQLNSRQIPGTERAGGAFFSPDGKWVGFFDRQSLKKAPLKGGPSITLTDKHTFGRGSWSEDGAIVYGAFRGALWRIAEEGGEPEELRPIDARKGETDVHLAEVLPGGRGIVYALHRSGNRYHIEVLSLETRISRVLIEDGFSPRYAPSGHIIYGQSNRLHAAPFDPERLEFDGAIGPRARESDRVAGERGRRVRRQRRGDAGPRARSLARGPEAGLGCGRRFGGAASDRAPRLSTPSDFRRWNRDRGRGSGRRAARHLGLRPREPDASPPHL